jgi:hypothetical protein
MVEFSHRHLRQSLAKKQLGIAVGSGIDIQFGKQRKSDGITPVLAVVTSMPGHTGTKRILKDMDLQRILKNKNILCPRIWAVTDTQDQTKPN